MGAHHPDALSIHTDARNAAGQTSDRAAEAYALANLGVVHMRQGRYERAAEHYRRALSLFRETGDRGGEARTLTHLGLVNWRQGRYEEAADGHRQALILYRETGRRIGEANALANHTGLAHTHHAAGEHGLARLHWQPAPPPPGVTGGPVCYAPNVVAAATLLASTDVIGVERAADLMGALLKAPVSTGFVSRCLVRLDAALTAAGFEDALKDALRASDVLGTDETPAPLTTAATSAEGCGNPHVYTARTMRAYTGGGPDLIWYGRGGRPDQGAGHRVRDPGRLPRGPGPRRLRRLPQLRHRARRSPAVPGPPVRVPRRRLRDRPGIPGLDPAGRRRAPRGRRRRQGRPGRQPRQPRP